MKKVIYLQIKQSFQTRGFFIALAIGLFIAITHFVFIALPEYPEMITFLDSDYMLKNPYSVFTVWMGQDMSSLLSHVYFLIVPLLAALPFGTSFFQEVKTGYIQNLCIRMPRRDYFVAKYIAVFLSGAIVVCIPLIFNFVLCAMVYPIYTLEVVDSNLGIYARHLFSAWAYEKPFLYVIIRLGILCIMAGSFATFSLFSSYYVNYAFMVLCMPFVFYIFLLSLFNILGMYTWMPNELIHPGYGLFSLTPIIVIGLMFLVPTWYQFIYRGSHSDVY